LSCLPNSPDKPVTDLNSHLRERLLAAIADLELPADEAAGMVRLDPPKNRDHGDVALGAFQLAKLAKLPPPKFASDLAARITPDDVIESAEAAGPFVNFRFRRAAMAREVLTAIQSNAAPYGKASANEQVVCIDFSSP